MGIAAAAGGGKERMLVSVRVRPVSDEEAARGETCDWECVDGTTLAFRSTPPERPNAAAAAVHTFDRVYGGECSTEQVYEGSVREVALSVVNGINSTIFAYGQTNSGKTYTMAGITELAMADIFDCITRHEGRMFVLKFSGIEIYNEAARDLLYPVDSRLRLLDDLEKGTVLEKVTEETVRDLSQFKHLLSMCEAQRQTAETESNETSSRSHQIIKMTVESSPREFSGVNSSSTLAASVYFVDLAGSEPFPQALPAGHRIKEGCHINRSLFALGSVIRKLSKGRHGHIPYRDSKLTHILQPALGGNARTSIICTICPTETHIEQSKNTLLFASYAKKVVTNARVNVVVSEKVMAKRQQNKVADCWAKNPRTASSSDNFEAIIRKKDAQIKKMGNEINELLKQRDLAESQLEDLLHSARFDSSSREPDDSSERLAPIMRSSRNDDEISTSDLSSDGACRSQGPRPNWLNKQEEIPSSNEIVPRQNEPKTCLCRVTVSGGCEIIGNNSNQDAKSALHVRIVDSDDPCKEDEGAEMDELPSISRKDASPPYSVESEGISSMCRPISFTQPYVLSEQSLDNAWEMSFTSELELSSLSSYSTVEPEPQIAWEMSSTSEQKPGSFSSYPTADLEQQMNARKIFRTLGSPSEESPRELRPLNSDYEYRHEAENARKVFVNFENPRSEYYESSRELRPLGSHYNGEQESRSATVVRSRSSSVTLNFEDETEMILGTKLKHMAQKLKGMALKQHDAKSIDDQVGHLESDSNLDQVTKQGNDNENVAARTTDTTNAASSDSSAPPPPSSWPRVFATKREEIIELWCVCLVPLVHRSSFFLHFGSDPADSIYVEVELKRLSYLQRYLFRKPGSSEGENIGLASSAKILRDERVMLCGRIKKKLGKAERRSLYKKWGVELGSKHRKLQLVQRLWTQTKDLRHIRESATLVAKLMGMLEPGEANKEMFGLSFKFKPQLAKSWKAFQRAKGD